MDSTKVWAAAAAIGISGVAALALGTGTSGAGSSVARADLHDQAGNPVGSVVFKQVEGEIVGQAEVQLPANSSEFHGFHIHANDAGAACTGDFTAVGGHWNPGGTTHGSHAGDLPVLMRDASGHAEAEIVVGKFQPEDIIGRAVIVHVGPDNYANIPASPYGGPQGATLNTGDAGGRFACAIVEPRSG